MKKSLSALQLVVFLLIYCGHASGQPSRQRAFLVTNKGDTLHGWIVYKGWEQMPRSVQFSLDSLSQRTVTYRATDLRYCQIAGAEAYEKAIIPKDSLTNDTVLLRLLVRGQKLSLYKLGSEQYFIRVRDGAYEEATAFALNTYAEKYDLSSLFPQINAAGTDESALIKIIITLNGNDRPETFTKPVMPTSYIGFLEPEQVFLICPFQEIKAIWDKSGSATP